MSRSKDVAAENLAESLMPGWTVVKSGSGSRPESGYKDNLEKAGVSIVTMPSLDKLKAKYVGVSKDSRLSDHVESIEGSPDTAIVDLQNGPLTKTVAISKSRGKVLWSQG
jgi:hypothetical protein